MADSRKTYFIAPTRTHPPNGRIVLGNIIEQPQWPEETVLNTSIVPIPPECGPYEHCTEGLQTLDVKGHDTTPGVFASFLSQIVGLGADLDIGRKSELEQRLFVKQLETKTFEPSKAYIEDAMREEAVRDVVLKKKLWLRRGRVYMITGIKIAHGASALTRRLAELHMHVQLTANLGILTGTGAPVDVGPKFDHSHSNEHKEGFAAADDFVYAYRLSRIMIKDNKFVTERYRHGVTLDDSEDDSDDDDDDDATAHGDRMSRMTFELGDADVEDDFDGAAIAVEDDESWS